MDLDQALHVDRAGDGFRVHYAIADVAAFVTAGDAIDVEAHKRGETLYGADAKIPLHPKVLSEDAASLLPDQMRPALLWTI
jgi:exoribonuclease R